MSLHGWAAPTILWWSLFHLSFQDSPTRIYLGAKAALLFYYSLPRPPACIPLRGKGPLHLPCRSITCIHMPLQAYCSLARFYTSATWCR